LETTNQVTHTGKKRKKPFGASTLAFSKNGCPVKAFFAQPEITSVIDERDRIGRTI
tara:strand:- start:302 stop:469 length:168 start_codon:yes stop_codon:yes gene_type:complete